MNIKVQHLFEIEIFGNILFTVTFEQFNAPLLNKSSNFFSFLKYLTLKLLNSIVYNNYKNLKY